MRNATVEGFVYDSQRKPLRFANVYISGTTIGIQTDSIGFFSLKEIPYGTQNLVVQLEGYRYFNTVFDIITNEKQHLSIKLEEEIKRRNTVEVIGKDGKEWRSLFKIFEQEFFGQSKLFSMTSNLPKFN